MGRWTFAMETSGINGRYGLFRVRTRAAAVDFTSAPNGFIRADLPGPTGVGGVVTYTVSVWPP